jgi:hypothetical protein
MSSGHSGLLTVTILNVKQQIVRVQKTVPELDYAVLLASASGTQPPRTEYGRKLLTKERGGRRSYEELNLNESTTDTVDLGKLFELTTGLYKVTLSRQVTINGSKVVLEATASFNVP